jgi:hypothetical protein
MDKAELDRLESLERAATARPWAYDEPRKQIVGLTRVPDLHWTGRNHTLGAFYGENDDRFTIALRNSAPALIAAAREREELLNYPCCPKCGNEMSVGGTDDDPQLECEACELRRERDELKAALEVAMEALKPLEQVCGEEGLYCPSCLSSANHYDDCKLKAALGRGK